MKGWIITTAIAAGSMFISADANALDKPKKSKSSVQMEAVKINKKKQPDFRKNKEKLGKTTFYNKSKKIRKKHKKTIFLANNL